MDVFAISDRGKIRIENQDSVYLSGSEQPILAIVADGMGGHSGGSVASQMTVSLLTQAIHLKNTPLSDAALKTIAQDTSKKIWEKAQQNPMYSGMGTTCSLVLIQNDRIQIMQVGDSRVYLFRGGKLEQITKDHSYVQYLIDNEILSPEEAEFHPYRNVITRALGLETVEADIFSIPLLAEDRILICSDGLTKHITLPEMEKEFAAKSGAKELGESLLHSALEAGGTDNISIVILINQKEDAK